MTQNKIIGKCSQCGQPIKHKQKYSIIPNPIPCELAHKEEYLVHKKDCLEELTKTLLLDARREIKRWQNSILKK